MGPAIFVPIFRKSDNSEENKMSGCGCSFSPAEEIKEEVKYTDALAEQFAKEVGVDPRPNETFTHCVFLLGLCLTVSFSNIFTLCLYFVCNK